MKEEKKYPIYKTGLGQDSHRFLETKTDKKCILAGEEFDEIGFSADSDGDVVYHAICNAITSVTHVHILGDIAIELCHKKGIKDSKVYLQKAVDSLKNQKIVHVAISIEAKRPKLQKKIDNMRKNISDVLKIDISQVGITATSGDGLSDFGKGKGVQVFCIITVEKQANF